MVDGGGEIKGRKKDWEIFGGFRNYAYLCSYNPIKATQMRTNILLTMTLVAGMMLAGCAKEESSEESRKGNDMEQTLTKEQIVGVWRSGDYWVSFSESGYASAFLRLGDLEMIDDGDYRLNGDTIITIASPWLLYETPYIVNSVTDTELSLTVEHVEPGVPDTRRKGTVVLQKSQISPCERNDGLTGKVFYFSNGVIENKKFEFDKFKTINGEPYVYLVPNIYFLYHTGGGICIGELSNLDNDTITFKKVR